MERKRSLKIILAAIICIAAIVSAFLFGKQTGSSEAAAAYQAEREKHILWNRGDLQFLEGIEETIYVTGHKSPDTDTVCSAILCAKLLNEMGYDAQPVVLGDINNETKYVLDAAGVEVPPLLEDASGKTFALVDHSDYLQTADGMKDANVVMIIDHHGVGSLTTSNQVVYIARPFGATATILGVIYYNYGIEIDPQSAILMLGAILSDTDNLKSANTTPADPGAVEDLCAIAGIEDVDAFYAGMFKAKLSYEGKTDEEIFFNDYKEYESGGTKYAIGCVEAYDEEAAEELAERMLNVFPSVLTQVDAEIVIAQVSVFHDDLSLNYLVGANEATNAVLEEAFEGRAYMNGPFFVIKPGISRKRDLVPAVSAVLEAHPKE